MSADRGTTHVVGQPVRRMALLRALRSNPVASVLAAWTIVSMGITVAVLVQRDGVDRPFRPGSTPPVTTGVAVAQWWVLTMVAGLLVVIPVLTVLTTAGRREQRLTDSWRSTLVTPWRVLTGQWSSLMALVLLVAALGLPPAGLALALGGTSAAQLGIGLVGAIVGGSVAAAIALATSCRSRGLVRPLLATLGLLAVLTVGPFVAHGARHNPTAHQADAALAVSPLVGIADAAAPHTTADLRGATAAQAPLTHLRSTVELSDAGAPPWARTLVGAVALIVVALAIARLRIRRSTRH